MDETWKPKVTANLFPFARPSVEPWDKFPWHLDKGEVCDTWRTHSSQALAIDVFGTLKMLEQRTRDRIVDGLCAKLKVRSGGPWQIHLEWCDIENSLQEPRPTQVDAIAEGRRSLLFFEVKFTERGGCCSQRALLTRGAHRGVSQCNGNYELQINPANGINARCVLAGKGIRYWEIVPKLFLLDKNSDYRPCPFAGHEYQWMRNLTLCREIARRKCLIPAFSIAYIANPHFEICKYFQSTSWESFVRLLRPKVQLRKLDLLEFVQRAAVQAPIFEELSGWLQLKIERVRAAQHHTQTISSH